MPCTSVCACAMVYLPHRDNFSEWLRLSRRLRRVICCIKHFPDLEAITATHIALGYPITQSCADYTHESINHVSLERHSRGVCSREADIQEVRFAGRSFVRVEPNPNHFISAFQERASERERKVECPRRERVKENACCVPSHASTPSTRAHRKHAAKVHTCQTAWDACQG